MFIDYKLHCPIKFVNDALIISEEMATLSGNHIILLTLLKKTVWENIHMEYRNPYNNNHNPYVCD